MRPSVVLVVMMIDKAVVMLSCVATNSKESVPFDVLRTASRPRAACEW